jgi:hypothetical protein
MLLLGSGALLYDAPSAVVCCTTGMPSTAEGKGSQTAVSPTASRLHLETLRPCPEAPSNLLMWSRNGCTVAGDGSGRRGCVSSAYCAACTSSPGTSSRPTWGQIWSQHCSAHATNRYRAGARGQPCRTPALYAAGAETCPFTLADADVEVRMVVAQRMSPSPAPVARITSNRKGRLMVSYAFLKSKNATTPRTARPPPGCAALERRRAGSSCRKVMLSPMRRPGMKAVWLAPMTDPSRGPRREARILVMRR